MIELKYYPVEAQEKPFKGAAGVIVDFTSNEPQTRQFDTLEDAKTNLRSFVQKTSMIPIELSEDGKVVMNKEECLKFAIEINPDYNNLQPDDNKSE